MVRHLYLVTLLLISAAWIIPPTHLQTTWGSLKGGAVSATALQPVLDSALSVTDEKGSAYTISRFRFNYRQKTEYQNDSTGEVKTSYRLFSREFRQTTRIDSLWRETIKASLQPGDSFVIDNIIVSDASGKKALAPDLTFEIR